VNGCVTAIGPPAGPAASIEGRGSLRSQVGNLRIVVKKQIALVLAGAAASIAGGLRLVQELVERGDRHSPGTGVSRAEQERATPPPAPSSTVPAPESASPGTPPAGVRTADTPATTPPAATAKAPSGATKAELYEIATTLGIDGRSKMSKAELADAINAAG
jgi:hypothetical protein